MNLTRKVWQDLTLEECSLVEGALDSLCVPYKTRQHTDYHPFGSDISYTVETKLCTDEINGKVPYEWIPEYVDKVLNLKDIYDGADAVDSGERHIKKSVDLPPFVNQTEAKPVKLPTFDELSKTWNEIQSKGFSVDHEAAEKFQKEMHDNLKPSKVKLVLDIIKTFLSVFMRQINPFHKTSEQDRKDMAKVHTCIRRLKGEQTIIDEIEQHFERMEKKKPVDDFKQTTLDILADPELNKHCGSIEDMRKYLQKTGGEEKLKKALRNNLNPNNILSGVMDAFKEDLKRQLEKNLKDYEKKGFIESCPIPDFLGHTGQRVKFDDLPRHIQEELKQQLPLSVLRSNQCEIRKDGNKISVLLIK